MLKFINLSWGNANLAYIYLIKVNRLANKYYHQGTAPSATTEFVKGIP